MQKVDFTARVLGCERRLYRIARTILRSDADCEDAIQEALLRAWSRLGTLREEAYFETWLIRILINECRTLMRRRQSIEVELSEDIAQPDSQERALLAALLKLPEKHRIPLELHCIEGYSVKETAQLLHLPEGTVKWRLSRGRTLLKTELGEEA